VSVKKQAAENSWERRHTPLRRLRGQLRERGEGVGHPWENPARMRLGDPSRDLRSRRFSEKFFCSLPGLKRVKNAKPRLQVLKHATDAVFV